MKSHRLFLSRHTLQQIFAPSTFSNRSAAELLALSYSTDAGSCDQPFKRNADPSEIKLLTAKPGLCRQKDDPKFINDLVHKLEYVGASNVCEIRKTLDTKVGFLLQRDSGSLFLDLLNRLSGSPQLGIEVFDWKRKQTDTNVEFSSAEFTKAITFAGRNRNISVATELFTEAVKKQIQNSSTYNALMAAYMYNGLADRACSLFEVFRKDSQCKPTVVTFNILLSIYGRSTMVRDMEIVFEMMKDFDLSPNQTTFNTLIAGYVTAWLWDDMERIFKSMKESSVPPNTSTYFVMLRGYAVSGNLQKMEQIYELVKDHMNDHSHTLIRCMICAYCKSSVPNRVEKVETLLNIMPEDEYRSWLNVLLICLYAKENMMDKMEQSIATAFRRRTYVINRGVMRTIISTYFNCNAVDKLSEFVSQAESEGWTIYRSLYHCMMVLYGSQNRLEEMESVIYKMSKFGFRLSKRTFLIMYKAYSKFGQISKIHRIMGLMCKHGFEIPFDYVY